MIDRASRFGIMAGHGGGGPGYSAGALTLPDARGHRITSIALANSDHDDLGLQIAFSNAMAIGESFESN
jgi:D-alanyl-D-alanine carboxypeptidase